MQSKSIIPQTWSTKTITYVGYTTPPPGRTSCTACSNIFLWYFEWFLNDSSVSYTTKICLTSCQKEKGERKRRVKIKNEKLETDRVACKKLADINKKCSKMTLFQDGCKMHILDCCTKNDFVPRDLKILE